MPEQIGSLDHLLRLARLISARVPVGQKLIETGKQQGHRR
jgi:hypothetical protein